MVFVSKFFDELTLKELYEILKSRSEIFLMEQNIICQDLDDVDYSSLHCFYKENDRVIAYLRSYVTDKDVVKIGRVLTLKHKNGLGTLLMQNSLNEIKKCFNVSKIIVHAQTQAQGFYEKIGFETVSDEFLEEGVPHKIMELKL